MGNKISLITDLLSTGDLELEAYLDDLNAAIFRTKREYSHGSQGSGPDFVYNMLLLDSYRALMQKDYPHVNASLTLASLEDITQFRIALPVSHSIWTRASTVGNFLIGIPALEGHEGAYPARVVIVDSFSSGMFGYFGGAKSQKLKKKGKGNFGRYEAPAAFNGAGMEYCLTGRSKAAASYINYPLGVGQYLMGADDFHVAENGIVPIKSALRTPGFISYLMGDMIGTRERSGMIADMLLANGIEAIPLRGIPDITYVEIIGKPFVRQMSICPLNPGSAKNPLKAENGMVTGAGISFSPEFHYANPARFILKFNDHNL